MLFQGKGSQPVEITREIPVISLDYEALSQKEYQKNLFVYNNATVTAKNNGIQALYDAIAIDNPSVALFLKCGFTEVSQTEEYILVKKELDNKRSTGLRKCATHTKGLSHP